MPISPRRRAARVHAPQEVVRELVGVGALNASTRQPCGFTPVNTVRIDAVLPGRVHALQARATPTRRASAYNRLCSTPRRSTSVARRSSPVRFRVGAEPRARIAAVEARRVAGLDTELVEECHVPEYAVDRCNHIVTTAWV